ncbi:hypothetical protein D3C85_1801910 [compost metagenome]
MEMNDDRTCHSISRDINEVLRTIPGDEITFDVFMDPSCEHRVIIKPANELTKEIFFNKTGAYL